MQSRKNVAFVAQVWVDVLKFSSYITFARTYLKIKITSPLLKQDHLNSCWKRFLKKQINTKTGDFLDEQ